MKYFKFKLYYLVRLQNTIKSLLSDDIALEKCVMDFEPGT